MPINVGENISVRLGVAGLFSSNSISEAVSNIASYNLFTEVGLRTTSVRSGPCTLFDSAGNIVFAPEQRLVNPGEASSWTAGAGVTPDDDGAGVVSVAYSGSTNHFFQQGVSVTIGETYQMKVDVRLVSGSPSSASSYFQWGDATTKTLMSTLTGSFQTFTLDFTATSTATVYAIFRSFLEVFEIEIRNARIYRIPNDSDEYQTGATALFMPAFEYLGGSEYLRCESQSINEHRSSNLIGATVGTLGSGGSLPTNWDDNFYATYGYTIEVVEIGTDDEGRERIRLRLDGGPSSGDKYGNIRFAASSSDIDATVGEDWVGVIRFKYISGTSESASEQFRLRERSSGGSTLATHSTAVSRSGDWETLTLDITVGDPSCAHFQNELLLPVLDGDSYSDFVFDLVLDNLEKKAVSTSRIPSGSSPTTRSGCVVQATVTSTITEASAITVEQTARLAEVNTGTAQTIFAIGDHEANEIRLDETGGAYRLRVWAGSSLVATVTGGTATAGVDTKLRLIVAEDDVRLYVDDVSVGTPDTSAAFPTFGGSDEVSWGIDLNDTTPTTQLHVLSSPTFWTVAIEP